MFLYDAPFSKKSSLKICQVFLNLVYSKLNNSK